MSKDRTHGKIWSRLRRGLSGLLCAALLLGLLPQLGLTVQAANQSWAAPYMQQLVDWGVMRGDINGNLAPERAITRAEFVTLINRAYGYERTGGHPFTDVWSTDWYADDIDIAYNVGYFKGTSATTASPRNTVTREQAAVFLARNLMLQGTTGESLGFSDSRSLSEWSRGLIGAAAAEGVINGYSDGSFRPRNNITRGEVAAMLVRAIGTPINSAGEYELGSVYGNVTVNTSGVKLRNGVIVGDLYLTGGIDLGDVLLENVTVLGQIVVSGAGESNSSQSSVVLRNVEADKMIVDSIGKQFVTIRAEGNTNIETTSVRTNAYVDDSSLPGYGLSFIELDGDNGSLLQLAGNIKEVKNVTPGSNLQIVQGSAQKVTIDEDAKGSSVLVDTNTRVDELDLDVATNVTGNGDIKDLNVGAAGSTVEKLPEHVTIRPGITADIAGETMNSSTATESSAEPKLLAGFPTVRNIAPNSATAAFKVNKAGTIYWAMSAVSDGSVKEEDLVNPPVYGGNILKSGSVKATASNTEYTAQLSGLTPDGSYYVTAILEDGRGNRSPLKVAAFTAPDNTVPAFTTGYPVMTKVTTDVAQVTVMTNKSCMLYYALLPKGSSTPTPQELKANAVSGNLGYGVVDVVKNVTQPINVNRVTLEEKTSYDLYLWLTDYDGAKSSTVRKLTFTTLDATPPVVVEIMQQGAAASSAEIHYTLDEPGTLYWAIVPEGDDTESAFMNHDLDSLEAKVKVESGVGALKRGSSNASKADTDIRFAISGLNTNTTHTTSYTLFYVAKDKAGNYSAVVGKMNVRTLDTTPPTVTQEFTKFDDDNDTEPLADTDIRIVFSESVQGGAKGDKIFMDLYNSVTTAANEDERRLARENLAAALRAHITMYRVPATGRPYEVTVRDQNNQNQADLNWTVDWRYAQVSMEDGKMIVTLPTINPEPDSTNNYSALKLDSGATYYFHIEGIYDNALTPNAMGSTDLPRFRTVFARVSLSMGDTWTVDNVTATTPTNEENRIDVDFLVEPISVDRVDEGMRWDLLIWTDTPMTFTLYSRPIDSERKPAGAWVKEGDQVTIRVDANEEDGYAYLSLTRDVRKDTQPTFAELSSMQAREYGIHIDYLGGDVDSSDFTAWNHTLNLRVSVVAGTQFQLNSLSTGSFKSDYDAALNGGVASIGVPDPFTIRKPFTDSRAPSLQPGWPTITVGDISAEIRVMMDRPGRVYYIVFPLSQLTTGTGSNSSIINTSNTPLNETLISTITNYSASVGVEVANQKPAITDIPLMYGDRNQSGTVTQVPVSLPTVNQVTTGRFTSDVIKGSTDNVTANTAASINLEGRLTPNTIYYVCMVTRGTSAVYDTNVYCYRFTTEEAIRPTINLSATGETVNISVDKTTKVDYFLAQNGSEGAQFQELFGSGHANSTDWAKLAHGANDPIGKYDDGTYNFTYSQNGGDKAKMTVIDAMGTPCYQGTQYVGSVFDIYATTQAKNTYASLIRSSSISGNNIVMTGSGTYSQSGNSTTRNQVKCTGMSAGVLYTFVTVGNSSSGSGDAFRAYYPVSISDTKPPMVISASTTGTLTWDGSTLKSGQVIIVFSEPLYAVNTGSTTQQVYPVDNCSLGASGHIAPGTANATHMAVGTLARATSNLSIHGDGTHSASTGGINAITLDVKDLAYGSSARLAFNNVICDQSRNGLNRNPLTVTVSVVRTETGVEDNPYTYSVEISVNSVWDDMG